MSALQDRRGFSELIQFFVVVGIVEFILFVVVEKDHQLP